MTEFTLFCAILACVQAAPALAEPGQISSARGTASATVVHSIVLTHSSTGPLSFGILMLGKGGTITVTSDGKASTSGSMGLVSGSTVSSDAFYATGEAHRTFSISTSRATLATGAASMKIATNPSSPSGTFDDAGTASFAVGGTLTAAGNEPPGDYRGTYSVQILYN